MLPLRTVLSNVALFQAGWLCCVVGAARGAPWTGAALALAVVSWHLLRSPDRAAELRLIITLAGIGLLLDSALAAGGLLEYRSAVPLAQLAPVWIVALWACFATTLNVSLRWIRDRRALLAVFGAVGGPLAYLGGAGLGAVSIERPLAALAALSIGWAVIMLLAGPLSRRFDGWQPGPRSAPRLFADQVRDV